LQIFYVISEDSIRAVSGWTGTKLHNLSKIPGCGRALTLDAAHVAQSDDVRVLGVQLSSDLSLDKHVNVANAKCFFQLRRSLDDDSVATLVHAFVTSRVDYCGSQARSYVQARGCSCLLVPRRL